MFTRLKKNAGYYSLLMVDAVVGSVISGVSFALLNVPLAIITTGLNFGANIVAGIAMSPEERQKPDPTLTASAAAVPKDPPHKRAWAVIKKGRTYQKAAFRDPDLIVDFAASGAGLSWFFQGAVLGMKSLTVAHGLVLLGVAIAPPVGIVVGGAMVGLGLFGIIGGNHAKWKGLSKYFAKVFHKDKETAPKKPGFFKKLGERPRISKIINSKWAKGLKKGLLYVMTVESAVFTLIAAPAIIGIHVAAMVAAPTAIAASIVPLAIALNWVRGPIWHLFCAGRVAVRGLLGKKPKEDVVAKKPETQAFPPDPAPATKPAVDHAVLGDKLTDKFGKTADKPATDKKAVPESQPAPRAKYQRANL